MGCFLQVDTSRCDLAFKIRLKIFTVVLICSIVTACASADNHTNIKPAITLEEVNKEILRRISIGCKGDKNQDYWRGFCNAMVIAIRNKETNYNVCLPNTYKKMSDNELSVLLGAYIEKNNNMVFKELDQPFIKGMQNLFPCNKGVSSNE